MARPVSITSFAIGFALGTAIGGYATKRAVMPGASTIASHAPVSQSGPTTTDGPASQSVEGIVRDWTGRSVPHAVVTAMDLRGTVLASAQTNLQGQYRLRLLRTGEYRLRACLVGSSPMEYGEAIPFGQVRTILVASAPVTADFRLRRGGTLSGTVTDETGRALPGALVEILHLEYVTGRLQAVRPPDDSPAIRTDDRGTFRRTGLPEGEYVVRASLPQKFVDGSVEMLYASASLGRIGSVHSIRVADGETSTVMLRLAPVRSVELAGTVTDSFGGRVTVGAVRLFQEDDVAPESQVVGLAPDGQFHFEIPANVGRVSLTASTATPGGHQSAYEVGRVIVDVEGKDDTQININTRPGTSVSGVVTGLPPSRNTSPFLVATRPVLPEDAFPITLGVEVASDGRFVIGNIFWPSVVTVAIRPEDAESVSTVVIEGRPSADGLVLPGVSDQRIQMRIDLTSGTTHLTGRASTRDHQPCSDCGVLAFSPDERRWSDPFQRFVRMVRTDEAGHFEIDDLPAGDYRVVAMIDLKRSSATDPALLRSLVARALTASLSAAGVANIDLAALDR